MNFFSKISPWTSNSFKNTCPVLFEKGGCLGATRFIYFNLLNLLRFNLLFWKNFNINLSWSHKKFLICSETGSNCRHKDFQSFALPTELSKQLLALSFLFLNNKSWIFSAKSHHERLIALKTHVQFCLRKEVV